MQMSLRGFTSKDLRRGTDSINNSYVFLFFALFFSIILLNVTRSCKKQHREIYYSSSLKCSLFEELTNMIQYLQQTPGLGKQLLKWYHIHHNTDCNSSFQSTSGNNKLKNREQQNLILLRQPLRDSIFLLSYTVFLGWVLGFCLTVC